MNDAITQLVAALVQGDPHAASRLLPLGYDELRKLVAQRMAREQARQALQPMSRVHEDRDPQANCHRAIVAGSFRG
jgi:hypothetical protein